MKADLKTIELKIREAAGKEEVIDYLTKTLTSPELAEQLVLSIAKLQELENRPVVRISQEEFDANFRIIGLKKDGTPENRGTYKRTK